MWLELKIELDGQLLLEMLYIDTKCQKYTFIVDCIPTLLKVALSVIVQSYWLMTEESFYYLERSRGFKNQKRLSMDGIMWIASCAKTPIQHATTNDVWEHRKKKVTEFL